MSIEMRLIELLNERDIEHIVEHNISLVGDTGGVYPWVITLFDNNAQPIHIIKPNSLIADQWWLD